MPTKTRFVQLVGKMEGFGTPGKIPTIRHNPMDLRHSPNSHHPGDSTHADDVGTIDTDAHGWEDAERQAQLYASRGMTLRDAIYAICGVLVPGQPVPDGNRPDVYLAYVGHGLGLSSDTPMTQVLKIPAV